jgi:hypothetical protein
MILLSQNNCPSGLENASYIANIVLGTFSLGLAYYVFVYQRQKDKNTEAENLEKEIRLNKLNWFKDIIIKPKLSQITSFYDSLESLRTKFTNSSFSEDDRVNFISEIKQNQIVFRRNFINCFKIIDRNLYQVILYNVDHLTDGLTNTISNEEINLSDENTFDRMFSNNIQHSMNDIYALIMNYNGK